MDCPTTFDGEATSLKVQRDTTSIGGFCDQYSLRRHKFEEKADQGCFRLRNDWQKYIGPIERWGSCNPFEGNFGSVVLPLCKPDRLELACYIFEYAFLYDNVLESVSKARLDSGTENLVLSETDYRTVRSTTGTKQIQSKILLELVEIDKPCAEVFIQSWKEMVATTAARDKCCLFSTLEDYVDYRIVDTGAPFVSKLMCFGMGILLTEEEWNVAAPITRSCFAALGLVNDYFSFDIEWDEFQREGKAQANGTMTNLVWLYMQWENLSIPQAKERTKETVRRYETEYYEKVNAFTADEKNCSANLALYLRAQAYQITGNVAWSLRCPRYHPQLCPKAQEIFDVQYKEKQTGPRAQAASIASKTIGSEDNSDPRLSISSDSDISQTWSVGTARSSVSSTSSINSEDDSTNTGISKFETRATLSDEALQAPFKYISSLPSKGVREALIDALNVWLVLPDSIVKTIKLISQKLHSSSLMLDDIEDSSDLRRGHPATHTIFGASSTINSANFLLIDVINDVQKLNSSNCISIVTEELRNLFIGQSYDLHWTQQGECPPEEAYLEMVNQKTGGLFRLLTRLMNECAYTLHKRTISLDLMTALGEYFQIRDDYKNLTDNKYTTEKGFCEDLDEGKFSFPVVHAWNSDPQDLILRGLLKSARSSGSLPIPHKKTILGQLEKHGSMEYTLKTLKGLEKAIHEKLGAVERQFACDNWVMRLLVQKLLF